MSAGVATRILTEEHRLIERGLDCLAAIAHSARRDGRLDGAAASEALALVREFSDGCHHAKEEDRLFPSLERAGLPRDGGPLAVMLDDHESGRRHVAAMAAALERAAGGDASALAGFERHAGELDELLREHIAKEDQVLFPMAEDLLDGAAGDALLADFRRIESEAGARHRTWLSRLDALCDRCAVERLDRSRVPAIAREFL